MAENPPNLSPFIPDLRDLTSIIRTHNPEVVGSSPAPATTKKH